MAKISLIVNGNPVNANVDPRTLLVQFLRENLRLTGTHVGCDTSQCGACVVHLDGKAVKSCTTLAVMADGHEVKTIEGLARRRRAAASDAGSLPRASRPAMRLLHPRHDHDRGRHRPPQGPRSLRPHHPRRARRQSVPLHRLSEHRCSRSRPAPRRWRTPISHNASQRTAIQGIPMYEFKYHRPATVRQAANLLVKNEDAKVIAGGHTLLPVMKQRLASPPHLVDLSHIEGLDGIEMKGRSLVIGATATHRRCRELGHRRRGDPGAGRTRRPDRRSRGAPQGHHRRLARQQRSDRRLSRGGVLRSAPPSSPTSAASRRKNSFRGCSRPRSRATRSSPR